MCDDNLFGANQRNAIFGALFWFRTIKLKREVHFPTIIIKYHQPQNRMLHC